MKKLILLLTLLSTIGFSADRTIIAPDGNLKLQPKSGSQVQVVGMLTTNGTSGTISTQAGAYTILDTDGFDVILASSTSNVAITLPTALANTGRKITIKKIGTGVNSIDVKPEAAETLDRFTNANPFELRLQYDYATVVSDGTNWHIVDFKESSIWFTFTPTWASGMSYTTTNKAEWRKTGNSMEIILYAAGVSSGTCTGPFTLQVPNSFNAHLIAASPFFAVGFGNYQAANLWWNHTIAYLDSATVLKFSRNNYANHNELICTGWPTGTDPNYFRFRAHIPIEEFTDTVP